MFTFHSSQPHSIISSFSLELMVYLKETGFPFSSAYKTASFDAAIEQGSVMYLLHFQVFLKFIIHVADWPHDGLTVTLFTGLYVLGRLYVNDHLLIDPTFVPFLWN